MGTPCWAAPGEVPAPPHLVDAAEELPVEGGEVVGDVLGLHAVDLTVPGHHLDLLRERHLQWGGGV